MIKRSVSAGLYLLVILSLPYKAYAGTLEFNGVPVDITTTEGEDLTLVPGTDGNVQIGDGSGTNTYATTNDDLHVTGAIEVNGGLYADGGILTGADILPDTTDAYNLGSPTKIWKNFYVGEISATGNIAKIRDVAYVWPAAQGAASTYLRNDGAGNLTWVAVGAGSSALSGLTPATVSNTIDNSTFAQIWNWNLAATGNTALKFGESTAATSGGNLLNLATLATSTATPLVIDNMGTGNAFVVNDEAADATPFIIDASGYVGVNTPSPDSVLDVNGAMTMQEMAAPAASALEQGRIYFDATDNKFKVSENNGAYVDLVNAAVSTRLSAITNANAANTISNSSFAQIWNWNLAATGSTALKLGESTAATSGGNLLNLSTLASSTAAPLVIDNYGTGASIRINDESGDISPVVVNQEGYVGIGIAPQYPLHVYQTSTGLGYVTGSMVELTLDAPSDNPAGSATSISRLNTTPFSPTNYGELYSTVAQISKRGSGNVTRMVASHSVVELGDVGSSGVIAEAFANRAEITDSSAGISITDAYGYYYSSVGAATGQNYGLYLTGNGLNSSNAFAIHSAGAGKTYLGGNVGIGTTAPAQLLHVSGALNGDVASQVTNTSAGTAASAQLALDNGSSTLKISKLGTGYTTSGAYVQQGSALVESGAGGVSVAASNAAGAIRLYTGGTTAGSERLHIAASGAVGIGTSNPQQALTVEGTLGLLESGASPSYHTIIRSGDIAPTGPDILYTLPGSQASAAGQVLSNDGSGNLSWATVASGSATLDAIQAAATPGATIGSADNNVIWNWALATASRSAFTFGESGPSTNGAGAQSILKAATLGSSTAMPLWVVNEGGALSLRVDDAASDTSPFIIDAVGNVGIGTATADASLKVFTTPGVGNDFVNLGNANQNSQVQIKDRAMSTFLYGVQGGAVRVGANDGTSDARVWSPADSTNYMELDANKIRLNTNANDSILVMPGAGGRVGIGSATPAAGVDVAVPVTAASGSALGVQMTQTLTAGANNDVLTGLRIAPTFTNGAFTGVANNGLIVESGNVGIGTSAPDTALQVETASANGGLTYVAKLSYKNTAGDVAGNGPALLFDTGNNIAETGRGKGAIAYVYDAAASWNRGDIRFLQNSASDTTNPTLADTVMTIQNNGNVGIGNSTAVEKLTLDGRAAFLETTVPTATSNYGKLYVNSANSRLYFMNDSGGITDLTAAGTSKWNGLTDPDGDLALAMGANRSTFTYNAATGAGADLFNLTDTANNTGTGYLMKLSLANASAASGLRIINDGTGASFRVDDSASDTTPFMIDATGNVGIGTASTGGSLLTVYGGVTPIVAASSNSGGGVGLGLLNTSASGNSYVYYNFSVGGQQRGQIHSYLENHMAFHTYTGASLTEKMRIQGDGNIGIGTTGPSGALDVRRNITAASGAADGAQFVQTLTAAANNDVMTAVRIAPTFTNGAFTGVANYGLLVESGNVGIGTNAPSNKLEVSGGTTKLSNTGLVLDIATDAANVEVLATGDNPFEVSSDGVMEFKVDNNNNGIDFFRFVNGANGNLVTIQEDANVGIGTDAPASMLDVRGDVLIGVGTFNNPSAGEDTYVKGNLEVDGMIYGNAGGLTNVPAGALSGITDAIVNHALSNAEYKQTWNWQLISNDTVGMEFGEAAGLASTGGGMPAILKASTIATSTAVPLYVQNLGAAASFRVDDAGTDTSPFIVAADGNVGIGTTNALAQLHVQSDNAPLIRLNHTNALGYSGFEMFEGSTAKNMIYTVGSNYATADRRNAMELVSQNGNITFSPGATEKVRFQSNGNVGIGTTAPAAGLHVVDGNVAISSSTNQFIRLSVSASTANPRPGVDIGSWTLEYQGNAAGSPLGFRFGSPFPYQFYSTGMNINNESTQPNEWLTLNGRMSLGETTAPTASANYGKVYVKSSDSKLYFMNDGGTEYDLTAPTITTRWDQLQNPTGALALTMNAHPTTLTYGDTTAGTNLFNLVDTASNTGTGYLMTLTNATGSAASGLNITNLGTGTSFRVDDVASDTSPFIIAADGNVGIGSSTPARPLDVVGHAAVSGSLYTTSMIYKNSSNNNITFSANGQTFNVPNTGSQSFNFQIAGGSNLMSLLDNGSLGIGTSTPSAGLDVRAGRTAATGTATGAQFVQTLTAAANNDVMTGLRIAPTFTNGSFTGVKNYGLIVESGLVGIGTTAPTSRLDIPYNGDTSTMLFVGGTTSTVPAIWAMSGSNWGAYVSSESDLGFMAQSGGNISGIFQTKNTAGTNSAATLVSRANTSQTADLFQVQNSSNTAMTVINSVGNVGVGTTTVPEKLTVQGVSALFETTAPVSTANYGKIYVKSSDSKLYFMNDAGNEYDLITPSVSTRWDQLADPTGPLTLNMNGNTSTFSFGTATAGANLFNLTDGASNTGTGYLMTLTNATGSAASGLNISNLGVGTSFRVDDVASDTSPFVIDAAGNVGVGTTTADKKLSVAGAVKLSDGYAQLPLAASELVIGGGGTTDVASIAWGDGSGGNRLQFGTNGGSIFVPLVSFSDSGNIGIGTTSAGNKLHIRVSDGATNSIATASRVDHVSSGTVAAGFGVAQDFYLEDDSGSPNTTAASIQVAWEDPTDASEDASIRFNTMVGGTLTEAMRIDDSGNVGIGTTSAGYQLHTYKGLDEPVYNVVQNPSNTDAASAAFAVISATSSGAIGAIPTNYTQGGTMAHFADRFGVSALSDAAGLDLVSFSGDLRFYSGGFATTNERMRILANGNVGIGTTAPVHKLDIARDASTSNVGLYGTDGSLQGEMYAGGDTTNRNMLINMPAATGTNGTGDSWFTMRFNGAPNKIHFGDTGSVAWIQSPHDIYFKANTGNAPNSSMTPAMVIANTGTSAAGNVGIGSISPAELLDVAGPIKIGQASAPAVTTDKLYNVGGTLTWNGTALSGGGSKWTDSGATTYLTATGDNAAIGGTSADDKLDVTGAIDVTTVYKLGNNIVLSLNGTENTFVGNGIAPSLTSGSSITAVGENAGAALTSGGGNTLIGRSAGSQITDSGLNTFIGASAGRDTTTGGANIYIGADAGVNAQGSNNIFIGNSAAGGSTSDYNVVIGLGAGSNLGSGAENTILGAAAGQIFTTGTRNVILGRNSNGSTNSISDSIAIGYGVTTTASNQMVIGGSGTNGAISDVYIGSGVTKATPTSVAINASGGSGTDNAGASLTLAGGKATGNAAGGSINFSTSNAGSTGAALQSLTPKMTILANGNVGIGTTNPGGQFEVMNTSTRFLRTPYNTGEALRLQWDDNVAVGFNIANQNSSISALTDLRFTYYDGSTIGATSGMIRINKDQAWTSTPSTRDSSMAFYTTLDSTSTEYMRIKSDGNVGIGSTAPAEKLDVNGAVKLAQVTAPGVTTDKLYNVGGTLTWNGTAISGASAPKWNALTNPDGALGLTMAGHTTTLTYGNATAGANLFNLTDGASNSGTGYLMSLTNATGSAASGLYINNLGTGTSFRVDDAASDTTPFIIDAAGNVGVGTTTAGQPLFMGSPTVGQDVGIGHTGRIYFYTNAGASNTQNVITSHYSSSGTADFLLLGGVNGAGGAASKHLPLAVRGYSSLLYYWPWDTDSGYTVNASVGFGAWGAGGTDQNALNLYHTGTATVGNNIGLLFSANRTTSGITNFARIASVPTNIGDTTYTGDLAFYTANAASPAERMRIQSSGNVGIGTTSPEAALDVQKVFTATSGYAFGLSGYTVANPAGASSALYLNYMGAATEATNSQNITGSLTALYAEIDHNSSGTVDTTTGVAVDVAKNSTGPVTNMYGLRVALANSDASGAVTNAYGVYISDSNETGTITNDYGVYQVDTGALNYFGGNVGIGSTAPAEKLDVNGAVKLAQVTAPGVTTDKLYNVGGTLTWNGTALSGGSSKWTDAGTTTHLTSSDNVGIGTTSAAAALHVYRNGANAEVLVQRGNNTTDRSEMSFYPAGALGSSNVAWGAGLTTNSNDFRWWHWDGSTEVTRMTLTNTGNVGIGTTAPGALLNIGSGTPTTAANGIQFGSDTSAVFYRMAAGHIGGPSIFESTAFRSNALDTLQIDAYGGGSTLSIRGKAETAANTARVTLTGVSNNTMTSGVNQTALVTGNFSPTSGTGEFNNIQSTLTVNQTGGANGITRGLYVNPTLTAAADFRAIETANNTGFAFYGAGTAPSYFTGNIGIGTTNTAYKLHVSDSQTTVAGSRYQVYSTVTGSTDATASNRDNVSGYFYVNATKSAGANNVTNVGLMAEAYGGDRNYAALFPAGNVGIGSSLPAEKLDVNGAVKLAQVTAPGVTTDKLYNVGGTLTWNGSALLTGASSTLQGAYGNDTDTGDTIIALTTADDSLIFRNPAASGTDSAYLTLFDQLNTGAKDAVMINQAGTGYALRVNDDGTSTDSTPFIIDQNGNVSIGTTTGNYKLEISGSGNAWMQMSTPTANDYVFIRMGSTGVTEGAYLQYNRSGTGNTGFTNLPSSFMVGGGESMTNGLVLHGGDGSYPIHFVTGGYSFSNERMTITGLGNVGIGTTAPSATLDTVLTSTSTTAATQIGNEFNVTDTGVVTTGTDTTIGAQVNVTRSGATGGTINNIGLDVVMAGDAGGTALTKGIRVNTGASGDTRYGIDVNYQETGSGPGFGIVTYGTTSSGSAITAMENTLGASYNNQAVSGVVNAFDSSDNGTFYGFRNYSKSGDYMNSDDGGTFYGLSNEFASNQVFGNNSVYYGVYNDIQANNTGTDLQTIYGTYSRGTTFTQGSDVFYGNYVVGNAASTGGTQYGVYVDLSAGTATKYAGIFQGGNVGIGTTNPASKAVISNTLSESGTLFVEQNSIGTNYFGVEHSNGINYSGVVSVSAGGNDTVGAFHAALTNGTNSKNYYSLIGLRRNNSSWAVGPGALASGDYLPGIGFAGQSNTTPGTGMILGASILGIVDNTVSSGNLPSALVFHTSATNAAGLAERMRISSAGNVGIGSTAPAELLDVAGPIKIAQASAPGTTTDKLYNVGGTLTWNGTAIGGGSSTLQGAYGNDTDTGDTIIALTTADDSLIFRNPAASGSDSAFLAHFEQLATGAVDNVMITHAGTGYALRVNDDGTTTDSTPFVIAADGKVGIGTTAASVTALTVQDTARIIGAAPALYFVDSNTQIYKNGSTGALTMNGPYYNAAGTNIQMELASTATLTSGALKELAMSANFAPTSGTATFTMQEMNPTINQTGGANGITRGLYVNPTLTAAADFRAIEVAAGKSVFGGNVGIGTTVPTSPLVVEFASTAGGVGSVTNVTDSTNSNNIVSGAYSGLTLTGNGSKQGYGLYADATSNSTTSHFVKGGYFSAGQTGAVATSNQHTYGVQSVVGSSNGAGATVNTYAFHATANASVASGTVNAYGLYVANGSTDTNGTSTKYGVYVLPQTGSDNNYGAYFGSNVGIGSTSPAELLDVAGPMKIAQAAAPGVTTDKLYNVSGSLYWNGTNISSGGTPTMQSVYGNDADGSDAIIALTTADDSLIFRNPAASGTDSAYLAHFEQLATGAVDNTIITHAGTGYALRVNDDGTSTDSTPVVITSAGNVSIGTTTSNNLLTVSNLAGSARISMEACNACGGDAFAAIDMGQTAGFSGISYNRQLKYLMFNVDSNGYQLGLFDGGNVGIGTSSASNLFHAHLADAGTNTVASISRLSHVTSGTAAADFGLGQEFYLEDAAGNLNQAARIDVAWEDATNASEDASIRFNTMVAGSLAEVMRIDDVGNVGIGTTNPGTNKLMVKGPFLAEGTGGTGSYLSYDGANAPIVKVFAATGNMPTFDLGISGASANLTRMTTSTTGFSLSNNTGGSGTVAAAVTVKSANDATNTFMGVGTTATSPNSQLQVGGSVSLPITSKTAAYTATAADHTIVCDPTTAGFTITLPTAVGITGRTYVIKKITSSANLVTLDPAGTETIDGDATKAFNQQNRVLTIQSDGANWVVI